MGTVLSTKYSNGPQKQVHIWRTHAIALTLLTTIIIYEWKWMHVFLISDRLWADFRLANEYVADATNMRCWCFFRVSEVSDWFFSIVLAIQFGLPFLIRSSICSECVLLLFVLILRTACSCFWFGIVHVRAILADTMHVLAKMWKHTEWNDLTLAADWIKLMTNGWKLWQTDWFRSEFKSLQLSTHLLREHVLEWENDCVSIGVRCTPFTSYCINQMWCAWKLKCMRHLISRRLLLQRENINCTNWFRVFVARCAVSWK